MSRLLRAEAALALLLAGWTGCAALPTPEAGIVVEASDGAGAAAGLRPGDLLVSSRGPVAAALRSPFDLEAAELEAPRGPTTLDARRGSQVLAPRLPARGWGLRTRPILQADDAAAYAHGLALVEKGDVAAGVESWRRLAEALAAPRAHAAGWLMCQAARRLPPAEAGPVYARARELAPTASERAAIWRAEGAAGQAASDFLAAETAYRAALELEEADDARSLSVAATLEALGLSARSRGDLAAADEDVRRALALRREAADDGIGVATDLNSLGIVAWYRGDLDGADRLYAEALALASHAEPEGLLAARILNNMGLATRDHGDMAGAEAQHRKALAIRQRLAPESPDLAASLLNLAAVAGDRGNLEASDALLSQALALFERTAPGSLKVAITLNNLGVVARDRGDFDTAEDYFRRSLALRERIAPESLDTATSFSNLGGLMDSRGDLAQSTAFHEKALALRSRIAPDSPEVAKSLAQLGSVARESGDYARARELLDKAIAISDTLSAHGREYGDALSERAAIAEAEGDRRSAEAFHRKALAQRSRLTPGTVDVAESLHALGALARRSSPAESLAFFAAAVDALESQVGLLGGAEEVRLTFQARYAGFYRDLIEGLLAAGREREAFAVLERSRARALRAMLAERDIVFADVPPALAREQRALDAEYDRVRARLEELDPDRDAAQVETVMARLRALRASRAEIVSKIRQASPRLAGLRYPTPLGVEGAAAALDPGTLLLSYSVGPDATDVFVLGPRAAGSSDVAFSVVRLAVGNEDLRRRGRLFRGLIERGRQRSEVEPALVAQAARLYDDLVRPLEPHLERAERVLVCADGPLQALPFAALVRSRDPIAYLVEWKPLHGAASATVYGEIGRASAAASHARELVAFGDPAGGARSLPPLPASRDEVRRIAALFGSQAEVHLGSDATEAEARAIAGRARYVHFATHALLDTRFPLDSGLVLAAPGPRSAHNGVLQAWELFEDVRLDADLVTLSACETGLGREMGGEGLVGLTRAFQYAGARSVLASLWAVADRSTADLMQAFYSALRAGANKDEALRAAQLAMIRGPAAGRHPFRWAAFQLVGDYR